MPKKTVTIFLSIDMGFINTLCVTEQTELVVSVPVFYGNFACPVSVVLSFGVLECFNRPAPLVPPRQFSPMLRI